MTPDVTQTNGAFFEDMPFDIFQQISSHLEDKEIMRFGMANKHLIECAKGYLSPDLRLKKESIIKRLHDDKTPLIDTIETMRECLIVNSALMGVESKQFPIADLFELQSAMNKITLRTNQIPNFMQQ